MVDRKVGIYFLNNWINESSYIINSLVFSLDLEFVKSFSF